MTPDFPPPNSAPSPDALPAEPAPPPRWSLVDLGLFLGFGFLAFSLAYLLVMLGYVGMRSFEREPSSPAGIEAAAFLSVIFQMVFYVLLFGALYAVAALRRRLPFWQALKWKRLTLPRGLAFLAGGVILAVGVQIAPTILPDRKDFPLQALFSSPAVAYAIGAFAILIAPLMEELVFRGVLFAIFEDIAGLRFAVVSTAVLFTGMHIPEYRGAWNHIFLLLIVGLVFSSARGLTGSLAPSVLLHASYNLCQLVLLFFATDHFRTIQDALRR